MEKQFAMALPEHITPKKFVRTLQTAVSSSPNLAQCERNSLLSACMRAAADGLLPDGREAAIVPFKDKSGQQRATYMAMVSGILKKVRNSGELATITSQIVYKNDKFEYWIDSTGEHVEHRPTMFGERGEMIGAYALAKTRAGEVYIEVMSMEELNKVRNASRAKNSGPWQSWETEMHRKTVIKRLSKRLPMSTDLEQVIRREDEDLFDFNEEAEQPESRASGPTRTEKLVNEAVQDEPQEAIDVSANKTETGEQLPI